MKKTVLFLTALLSSTAFAANVSGSQTTPLTLKVNNYCQVGFTPAPTSFDKTYGTVDLGTINAVKSVTVANVVVMAVDCNYKTALNIVLPKTVTLTSGTNTATITQDTWDAAHPLTMAFNQVAYSPKDDRGPYQFYAVLANFKLGGTPGASGAPNSAAWALPGGTYTGNLVVSYNYDE